MNFIRDNIVKFGIFLLIGIIVIIVAVSCSNREKVVVDDSTGYAEMENRLQTAAIKYVRKNQNLLPRSIDKTRKIQLDTLVNNRTMRELRAIEDKNVKCSGYVEIAKKYDDKMEYRYTPYIKCGKYYETKTISDYIKTNQEVVTTGEGLYAYNNGFIFKGEYPSNYIMLGERLYRILEITEDGNLKVISTEPTKDSYLWDNRFNTEKQDYYGINTFEKSRMKDTLNFLYENTDENAGEIYFSSVEKEYIVEHDFCIGRRTNSDASVYYKDECSETSPLKVGLITLNEYYRTSLDSGCTAVNKKECNNYNFLFTLRNGRSTRFITLIGNLDNSYSIYMINSGELQLKYAYVDSLLYPVVYLNKSILYKSGSGTSEDPYVVR